EQCDFRRAAADGGERFRVDGGLELALEEHAVDVLAVRHAAHFHPGGGLEGDVFFFLAPPLDALELDAVVVLQDAAHPEAGGILQGVEADALAVEVGGLLDAAVGALHDVAVAEAPVWEHRNRGERGALVAGHEVGDERELADVEFLVAQHAPVALGRGHGEGVELDARRARGAVDQGAQQVVIAACERELELGHGVWAQLARMPLASTTFFHLAISAATKAANSSGIFTAGSAPCARKRSLSSGSWRIFAVSAARRSIAARGVPAGANIPLQPLTS